MKRFLNSGLKSRLLAGVAIVFAPFFGCSSKNEIALGESTTGGALQGDGDSALAGGSSTTSGGMTTGGGISGQSTACNGACVDLQTDGANCGACGVACEPGTLCKSGSCEGCTEGQTDCGTACVNTQSDPNNCGACGESCSLGASCIAGVCETCGDGLTDCDGSCVDTTFNPNHCGACGSTCGEDQLCSSGQCIDNTCFGPNELPCGDANACVDVVNNKEHCGACGQACPGDMRCIPADGVSRCGCDAKEPCDGQCTDTKWDAANCGGCGIQCADGQRCHDGSCICDPPLQLCGGSCKDPSECGGGATGALLPLPEALNQREIQRAASAQVGDGSVDCAPTSDLGGGTTSGGTPVGSGGVTDPNAGEHCGGETWTTGKSTWYNLATPLVHCGYPTDSLPTYYGAINDAQYANADVCGACVEIEANGKTLEVQIVDECPYVGNETWCYAGSNHIDLNPAAFNYFHAPVKGVFDMQWRYVPCSGAANGGSQPDLEYTFKEGSSIYWTGILIRNHPIPLASVEVAGPDGSFRPLERQEYNYWLLESGFGSGPYTLRITDTSGAVLEKSGLPSLSGTPLDANTVGPIGGQITSCQ